MGSIFTAGGMQVTKKLLVGDEVAVGLGKAAGAGARSIKIWSESDGVIQVRSGKDAASRVELLNGQQRAFMENRNGTSPRRSVRRRRGPDCRLKPAGPRS